MFSHSAPDSQTGRAGMVKGGASNADVLVAEERHIQTMSDTRNNLRKPSNGRRNFLVMRHSGNHSYEKTCRKNTTANTRFGRQAMSVSSIWFEVLEPRRPTADMKT